MEQPWSHATRKSKESWAEELGRMAGRDAELVAELERRGEYVKPTNQSIELYQQMFEENANAVRGHRWKNQAELAHWGSRFVNFMSIGELLRKLNAVGELAGFRAFYNDFSRNGMRGINLVNRWGSQKKFLCAAQNGWMPEFSIMRFDEHFLPQNEQYRGWRTVLLRLIDNGFATEQQTHQIFGIPTDGIGSRRYREELFATRNYCPVLNPWEIRETTNVV